MRPMETLQDLIDESKARTVLWAICIYGLSYFLTHTSKSMWMNIPISILILAAFRYLSHKVELHWRSPPTSRQSYLSQLTKKQLSVNDSRLSAVPVTSKWRKKIGSPSVAAAIDDFINKLLQDFVLDLWYSSITPDKEAPELIRTIIRDVIGEISGRVKEINLVDLLTRDVVDLVGNQLDLYRKIQSDIGINIMGTLSFEERDEQLKQHLIASKELHPALISAECEYKILQHMVGGVLALVMKSQEAKNPLVRCISRELLTCLVLQPVINLASPACINELIEYVCLATDKDNGKANIDTSSTEASSVQDPSISVGKSRSAEPKSRMLTTSNQSSDLMVVKSIGKTSGSDDGQLDMVQKDSAHLMQPRSADWALVLEAATIRRSQVLAPENLENMWTKGRNYQKKSSEFMKAGISSNSAGNLVKELLTNSNENTTACENAKNSAGSYNSQLKRSNSSPNMNGTLMSKNGNKQEQSGELIFRAEGSLHAPKLRCRVVGAYFEKTGSKSFAVYSIAVTDAENKTWFVKRRYRNFERLHRHLKDIPNYSLHLPPKRFLSSSIDDYFVHQRCILLDKYLQDLLAIANIAEQHEVWDFLSVSSKNYSFGKSTSVMKTLAVNVDDAMDDIVRQFKGVSDGLLRKVSTPSPTHLTSSPVAERTFALTWNEEEASRHSLSNSSVETFHSVSDDEVHDEDHSSACTDGWHSDNELNAKGFPPRVVKRIDQTRSLDSQRSQQSYQFDRIGLDKVLISNNSASSDLFEDLPGMPPEWTPPNVSVPLLNLVDKIFQLKRRGWLSCTTFTSDGEWEKCKSVISSKWNSVDSCLFNSLWSISASIRKMILQLMMEDAIDDWILRQIHWLRNDEIVARGIRWIHNVLWPNGTFFIKFGSSQGKEDEITTIQQSGQKKNRTSGDEFTGSSSFELQLEAARRASDVKKMILGGAPTALVSLIGHRQYERCAKDIYYFIQSTICVKQLAYGILELLLVTIFPELCDLVQDLHEKART